MVNGFQTNDCDLATYLCAAGFSLLSTKNTDGRLMFVFPTAAALSADAYYDGAVISAKRLLYTLRKLSVLGRDFSGNSSSGNNQRGYASAV